MIKKLQHRLPQTADRKAAFEAAVETELRRRLKLMGSAGIVSANGSDVNNDSAACAVIVSYDRASFSIAAGQVVFPNGETVEVTTGEIAGITISSSTVDSYVVRLEYGEVADGDVEASTYYNFAAAPAIRMKTAREMLVVETVASYNAQPGSVKNLSVVLGVVSAEVGGIVADNGRDTYSFSRPWSTPVDTQHRSLVGSGQVTPTNPHGLAPDDLTYRQFTLWQTMAGGPPVVLAKSKSVGRMPGTLCSETIPAGSFLTDSTGLITGVAGCFYAPLGYWPDRLTKAVLSTTSTEVAAWIPRGRNVVAVYDPVNFIVASSLDVYYTKVDAGALPGSLVGTNTVDMTQPGEHEMVVAGGAVLTEFTNNRVYFTDVGLIPMNFDILVGSDGNVYKRPDVLTCNTKLDTVGSGTFTITSQPRVPTRLRLAISNYIPAMTEVRFQIVGVDEDGAPATEQVSFLGPLPSPTISYTEVSGQRKFTNTVFASVTSIQTLIRNGDGPNTTLTVFAEHVPEHVDIADDLLLASVHWTGVEVTANYAAGNNIALDRRIVSRGGANKGLSPVGTSLLTGALTEGLEVDQFSSPTDNAWATIVEDFADPMWFDAPRTDLTELPANSLGARLSYSSRKIPFVQDIATPTITLRWIPRGQFSFPSLPRDLSVRLRLYKNTGGEAVYESVGAAVWNFSPFPPHQVKFSLVSGTAGVYYGAKVELYTTSGLPVNEVMQGFVLVVRGDGDSE